MSDTDLDATGPIDFIIVQFPADTPVDGSVLQKVRKLVDDDIIRVLDVAFVGKGEDGAVSAVEISDVGFEGDVDASLFAEAASGLFQEEDIVEAAETLEPGSLAVMLVFENRWAADLAVTLRKKGAQLVAAGRIPVQAILARLDELEEPETSV